MESPELFTEKLLARVLRDDPLPLYDTWDDKVTAPLYAAQKIRRNVRFAQRIGMWRSITPEILESLPRPCVVKTNIGSGGQIILRDDDVNLTRIASDLNARLALSVNARGERYERFILAEELFLDADGGLPRDLKFHCFHYSDRPPDWFLQIDTDRLNDHRQDIFDSYLERAPFRFSGMTPSDSPPPLPENIDEFVSAALDLSEDFDYMRIDLYDLGGEIGFGEFTPCHRSAVGWIEPRTWEKQLGDMWEWNPEGYFNRTS